MQDVAAEVVSAEEVAPGHLALRFHCPAIAAQALPGQFVHVRVNPASTDPLLRRPFSVWAADRGAGTVDLLVQVVGRGTDLLAQLRPGAPLPMLGPLGRPFGLPATPGCIVIVAGGVGVAPLTLLAEHARRDGHTVVGLLGARSADRLVGRERLAAQCGELLVATEDGSEGRPGLVTDLLAGFLRQTETRDLVCTCGPRPMMRRVAELCRAHAVPCQVSFESWMGCGVGACLGCVVPEAGGGMVRVCRDGPVFEAERIAWGRLDDRGGPGAHPTEGAAQVRALPPEGGDQSGACTAEPGALDMTVTLGPLRLRSPVVVASGTFGYGQEYADLLDLGALGAVCVKGLTLSPTAGNPPPRICETPSGMLNAIGLQNVGVEVFVRDKLPWLRERGLPVIANLNGERPEHYAELAERLSAEPGVVALELNVSCPNVARGGMQFGTDPEATRGLTAHVRAVTPLPLIVKLSPNVTDLVVMARAAFDGGADMLSLINTLLAMAVDAGARRPVLANVTGGLSGPAVRPVALRAVWQVHRALPTAPLIGMGGIRTGTDAAEFMLAGASAVAVGTETFVNPAAAVQVLDGLRAYCRAQGFARVRDITGALIEDAPR